MKRYDLVFVGHVAFDDIEAKEGSSRSVPGGAPLFGALAGGTSKKSIAIITRMAKKNAHMLALGSGRYRRFPAARFTHHAHARSSLYPEFGRKIAVPDEKRRTLSA